MINPTERGQLSSSTPSGSGGLSILLVLAFVVLALFYGPDLMTTSVGERGVMAATIGTLLLLVLVKSPRYGVTLVLIYLSILGGLRRWLIPAFGYTSTDPLVLVQAVVIGLYFISILATRRIDRDTRLAKCLCWMLALMALEVVNPLQGGITIGLAGILFVMVPPLWYYAGRRMGTPQIVHNVIRATLILSLFGAAYGMYQIWFGFVPSEMLWMRIGGVIDKRPFSFFTSMPEYAVFLSMGVAILWAAFLKGNRAAFLPLPFLFAAIFFLSSRGTVVGTLSTCVALWAVQGTNIRIWLPRLVIAGVLAVVGLTWSLQEAQHMDFGKTQELVEHQTSGLLDPGNSTAPGHATMVYNGALEGLHNPLGRGLGAATLAAGKFGKGSVTTETDWGDSFVSLGLPGGLLYTYMIGLILTTSVRTWMKTHSFLALATLGILLSGIAHWLHGDFFAMTMLVWFLIGAQDQAVRLSQLPRKKAL